MIVNSGYSCSSAASAAASGGVGDFLGGSGWIGVVGGERFGVDGGLDSITSETPFSKHIYTGKDFVLIFVVIY